MTNHELEPLEPDMQQLIEAGRQAAPVAPAVLERVLARVEASVAAAPPIHGSGAAGAASQAAALLSKPLIVGVTSFLLGMGWKGHVRSGLPGLIRELESDGTL